MKYWSTAPSTNSFAGPRPGVSSVGFCDQVATSRQPNNQHAPHVLNPPWKRNESVHRRMYCARPGKGCSSLWLRNRQSFAAWEAMLCPRLDGKDPKCQWIETWTPEHLEMSTCPSFWANRSRQTTFWLWFLPPTQVDFAELVDGSFPTSVAEQIRKRGAWAKSPEWILRSSDVKWCQVCMASSNSDPHKFVTSHH